MQAPPSSALNSLDLLCEKHLLCANLHERNQSKHYTPHKAALDTLHKPCPA